MRITDESYVPVKPFANWLERCINIYGVSGTAEATGLNPRYIYTLRKGTYWSKGHRYGVYRVSIGVVDNALTNEGSTMLWELYDFC